MWNPNVRSKTKVPILKLVGLLTVAAVFLLFPLLSVDVQAGSYRRPTPSSRPTEKVAPATLRNATESIQYTTPSGGPLQIGPLKTIIQAGAAVSNAVIVGLQQESIEGGVTVYRVEGIIDAVKKSSNIKIAIDENGMVNVLVKSQDLYLNFGDKERALQYFKEKFEKGIQKLPGGLEEPRLKSFEVPESFLDELKREAVPQTEHLKSSNLNKPFIVDKTKAANQFGLTRTQIAALKENIIQGSGKDITDDAMRALTSKVKNPGLIEKFGEAMRAKFPAAVEAGERFLGNAGKVLVKLGPLFAVAGVVFGALQMWGSGTKLWDMMQKEGILEALSGKDGQVAALETLSGFFGAIAGGAFLLSTATAATVVGAPVAAAAASVAAIAGIVSLLFAGTALVVENWDAIVKTATDIWEGAKDGAVKAYRWVAGSASSAATWAGDQVDKLVFKTKNLLTQTGQMAGELVRGAVQVTEQVVEQVTVMVPKIIEYVEEKVINVVRTGVRMVERMVEEAKEILEPVVRIGERMVTRLIDVARQVPRTVYETATRMVDRVVSVMRNVTEYVTTRVEEAYQYAVQVVRNVTEWVTERVQEAYEVVRQIPRQITEWIVERVRETRQVARTVYDTVYEWITEWVQETYPVVSQVARTVWETVTEWVPRQVRSWLGRFWGWAMQWVARTFQRARTVYDTVVNYATRWVQRSRQVARQVARTVYDTVAEWVNRSRPVTRTVYDTVQATLYRWVERPVQRVRQIVETVWRTGTRLVDRVVPVVRQITEYVTTKVEETYQIVRTVYDTIVEKVPQLVRETYEYIEQVPRTIMTQVKKLVPEQYEYTEQMIEQVTKTRTEIVPEIRQIERAVTKTVEGWIPKLP